MKPFKLPEYLKPYEQYFNNTGGNNVEYLINKLLTDKSLLRTNEILGSLAMMTYSQYQLLETLYKDGKLK